MWPSLQKTRPSETEYWLVLLEGTSAVRITYVTSAAVATKETLFNCVVVAYHALAEGDLELWLVVYPTTAAWGRYGPIFIAARIVDIAA